MAIEYSLPIETNQTIAGIEKLILALDGFEPFTVPKCDDQTIVGPGLVGVWVLSQLIRQGFAVHILCEVIARKALNSSL